MSSKKVDLIQIGFQKCGTTSLYRWLRQHPDLEFYNGRKDPQFFNREKNWREKIDLYHSHFSDPNKLWAEASDQYTTFPEFTGTAKKIYDYNPDIKFVAVIRDPVERTLSHYDFNKLRGGARGDNKEEVILEASKYTFRSQYFLQLKQFLELFKKEQFKIVLFDELKENPKQVLSDTFNYLGIQDISEELNYDHSKSTVGEYHQKFKYKKLINSAFFKTVKKLSPSSIRRSLKPIFYGKASKKTGFTIHFKQTLWKIFDEDISRMESHFNLNLDSWRNKYI